MLNQVVLVGTLSSVPTIEKDSCYFTITMDSQDKMTVTVDCVIYDELGIDIIKQSKLNNMIGVKGYLQGKDDNVYIVVESISILDDNGNETEYIK